MRLRGIPIPRPVVTTNPKYVRFQRTYFESPDGFMRDCVNWPEGESPSEYQQQIGRNLVRHHREAVKGPRRLGKTALAALLVLWFSLTRDGAHDWKLVTMAGGWGQLKRYLWPEVHKWARVLRWDVIGRPPFKHDDELLKESLQLTTGAAFGMVSDRPELIEGAGAKQYFLIMDEAKSITDSMFDAAEGSMASGGTKPGYETFALMISTPPQVRAGRFYDIFARKAGLEKWHPQSVTMLEAVGAGRVSREWVDDMARLWGTDSPNYQTYVLGEFSDIDTSQSVIPLPWVEAAIERWIVWDELGRSLPEFKRASCDVARFGDDLTVIGLRYGNIIAEIRRFSKKDLMETTGNCKAVLDGHPGPMVIDVDGIGGGVVDRLNEQGYKRRVRAFKAEAATDRKDASGEYGFTNCRSGMWWNMREMLAPESGFEVMLPPDDKVIGDLTAPTWRVTSGGKIQVEPKADIRKRIGRSTDDGDMICQAFWEDSKVPTFTKIR